LFRAAGVVHDASDRNRSLCAEPFATAGKPGLFPLVLDGAPEGGNGFEAVPARAAAVAVAANAAEEIILFGEISRAHERLSSFSEILRG